MHYSWKIHFRYETATSKFCLLIAFSSREFRFLNLKFLQYHLLYFRIGFLKIVVWYTWSSLVIHLMNFKFRSLFALFWVSHERNPSRNRVLEKSLLGIGSCLFWLHEVLSVDTGFGWRHADLHMNYRFSIEVREFHDWFKNDSLKDFSHTKS